MCTGPPFKQKSRKLPAPAHMGPSATDITNTTVQASQPATQQHIHLTPPTGSPLPPPSHHFHTSPTNTKVGGAPILFPYGKYTHVSQIPPSYLQQVLH